MKIWQFRTVDIVRMLESLFSKVCFFNYKLQIAKTPVWFDIRGCLLSQNVCRTLRLTRVLMTQS